MKNSFVIKFVMLFLFSVGTGCEEVVVKPMFTIGTASEFRPNLLYTSSDGLYAFRITEVNDSRCPEGAQCIWAGEVYIKGEWIENSDTTDVEIHSLLSSQQKQPDGFTMQIQDAKPYPKLNSDSNPEDLTITFLITKN